MSKISVIIPSFNRAKYLGDTIRSVLGQSFQDFEIIIVDDGSTDNTKEIVLDFQKRDNRIKYLYQNNKGTSSAKNTGIKLSQGDFLQFLDSDDLIEEKKLEVQVYHLNTNPDTDIVYSDARFFPDEDIAKRYYSLDGKNRPWMPKISGSGEELLKLLLSRNIMPTSAPLLRKNIFKIIKPFDESLICYEDWDLWIRCALANKKFFFLNSEGSLTLIRFHPNSLSTDLIKMYKSKLKVQLKIMGSLNGNLLKINKRGYNNTSILLLLELFKKDKRFNHLIKLLYHAFKAFYFKAVSLQLKQL